MRRTFFLLSILASGCCDQAPECPEQSIVIFVTEAGASVQGVSVDGDAAFVCAEEEGATVCRPETTIPDGDYALTVTIAGRESVDLVLPVHTRRVPPFSCECEIPEASHTIELEPPAEDTDAGA